VIDVPELELDDEIEVDEEVEIDDDELAALALAADSDAPLADDAVSLWQLNVGAPDLLPEWYMPPPMPGRRRLSRGQRRVAWLVIATFVAIDAYGLCSTYGSVVWA
jgi:hypothetical protein